MKKTLSKLTALSLALVSLTSLTSNATEPNAELTDEVVGALNENIEEKSPIDWLSHDLGYVWRGDEADKGYDDFIKMSDDYFREHVTERTYRDNMVSLRDCWFGDDSVDDALKFENFFLGIDRDYITETGDIFFLKEDIEYIGYYASGKMRDYITVFVDENVKMNHSLKPSDFGFSDSWKMEVRDGPFIVGEMEDRTTGITHYKFDDFHEYRIYPPAEVYADFETFVRLWFCTKNVSSDSRREKLKENGYGGVRILQYKYGGSGSGNKAEGTAGDANNDDKVTIADATAILQSIGNPDMYSLDAYGKLCADVYNKGDGITAMDALTIMEYEAGLTEALPKLIRE